MEISLKKARDVAYCDEKKSIPKLLGSVTIFDEGVNYPDEFYQCLHGSVFNRNSGADHIFVSAGKFIDIIFLLPISMTSTTFRRIRLNNFNRYVYIQLLYVRWSKYESQWQEKHRFFIEEVI